MAERTRKRRNPDRAVLLICCTREEADQIRGAAKKERRSISAFVLNAVMTKFAIEERIRKDEKSGAVSALPIGN